MLAAPFAPSSSRQLRSPRHPFHSRRLSRSSVPARSHAILATQSAPIHNESSESTVVSCSAAPFVFRSTIRSFLEVTVPILHISPFPCRVGAPVNSRPSPLVFGGPMCPCLPGPAPSATVPTFHLGTLSCHSGSPVSYRARLIPTSLPVRLLRCPARLSRPQVPLPRADCRYPPRWPPLMLFWLPGQLPCTTAHPLSLPRQLLSFPTRPSRPRTPRLELTAPPHQPLTPPQPPAAPMHQCPFVIAPCTNAHLSSPHARLPRTGCP